MKEKDNKKTVVISAGGTGGHLFPAEALAAELMARGHHVVIMTDKRGEAFKSLGPEAEVHIVRAATLKPGLGSKIRAVRDMAMGILSARKLLKKIKPDAVVGFGGYPSFPGVFAGQRLGIPTILHEQNAVLGKANDWLASGADVIALSLDGAKGVKSKNLAKVVTTGNPVRKAIIDAAAHPYPATDGDIRILVTGGSQASKSLSEVVPLAAALLDEAQKGRLFVMHQCRADDLAETEQRYKAAGVRAEIRTFFNDIADRLRDCHLFLGRSGASTVAEVAVVGRPSIFIPDPRHKDMQQKYNAELLSEKGGAWLMLHEEFTPAALAGKLGDLLSHVDKLEAAAAVAKTCGLPNAAERLADVVEARMQKGQKRG